MMDARKRQVQIQEQDEYKEKIGTNTRIGSMQGKYRYEYKNRIDARKRQVQLQGQDGCKEKIGTNIRIG